MGIWLAADTESGMFFSRIDPHRATPAPTRRTTEVQHIGCVSRVIGLIMVGTGKYFLDQSPKSLRLAEHTRENGA